MESNSTSACEPLPLGWTQIRRRPTNDTNSSRTDSRTTKQRKLNNEDNDCIADDENNDTELYGTCRCAIHQPQNLINQTFMRNNDRDTTTIVGKAIFCLHDTDPQWFQGYFVFSPTTTTTAKSDSDSIGTALQSDNVIQSIIPTFASNTNNRQNKDEDSNDDENNKRIDNPTDDDLPYWGLLCQQEEIDDCLQCQDGGYRQLTISITPFVRKKCDDQNQLYYKRKIPNVIWTGGDMIQLFYQASSSSSSVPSNTTKDRDDTDNREVLHQMIVETNQLLTGNKAVPYVTKYFASLVRNLQSSTIRSDEPDGNAFTESQTDTTAESVSKSPILELIPNVAIVLGTVSIQFANTKTKQSTKSVSEAGRRNSNTRIFNDQYNKIESTSKDVQDQNKRQKDSVDTTYDPLFDD